MLFVVNVSWNGLFSIGAEVRLLSSSWALHAVLTVVIVLFLHFKCRLLVTLSGGLYLLQWNFMLQHMWQSRCSHPSEQCVLLLVQLIAFAQNDHAKFLQHILKSLLPRGVVKQFSMLLLGHHFRPAQLVLLHSYICRFKTKMDHEHH